MRGRKKNSRVRTLVILFTLGIIDIDDFQEEIVRELKKMNVKKRGGQFIYPDSFMAFAFILKCMHGWSYRTLVEELKKCFPDYSIPARATLHDRFSKNDIDLFNDILVDITKSMSIAMDSSGFRQHAGSKWIEYKWKINRAGFVKAHLLIDVKTKTVLACSVTTDKTADSSLFIPLIKELLQTFGKDLDNVSIIIFADKVYDTNAIHQFCKDNGIIAIIPVKKDARADRNNARSKQAQIQFTFGSRYKDVQKISKARRLKYQNKWKQETSYGQRAAVEGVFSTIKRLFGEDIKSKNWGNIIKEIYCKIAAHNIRIIKNYIHEKLKNKQT